MSPHPRVPVLDSDLTLNAVALGVIDSTSSASTLMLILPDSETSAPGTFL